MVSFFRRILPARWFASDPLPPADPVQAAPAVPQPLPGPGAPPWRTGRWSTEVLANMQERQFQALCKALFAPVGAEVQALPRQPGGVLDLRLYSQRERTPMTVVRCMHHPGSPVDVPELREFLQEIAQQRLRHGTFATSSSFTPEALDFASDSGFSALDGDSLLAMIERRTPQQQRALLAAACEPER
ncbi:MAG: restriction endonuclease [Ramlibacter sp.]|jgi:restriction system protein|nr:restriction endonuclease [Ramlibacter sp.]